MLELNFRFRSVAYLLIYFTSFVQYTGVCFCNAEQIIYDVVYENTKTNNIHEYSPNTIHSNFTTAKWIQSLVSSDIDSNLPVKWTLGHSSISKYNGLLLPYRVWPEETLDPFSSRSARSDLTPSFNLYVNSSLGFGLACLSIIEEFGYVFASSRDDGWFTDKNETYIPQKTCSEPGISDGAVVGITAGVVAVVLLLARCLYNELYRKTNAEISSALLKNAQVQLMCAQGLESNGGGLEGITVDKAVEFSYEELSKATNNFHLDNKIGQGGFGSVYYAELRAEEVAIKKMDTRASKEFLAELNVLTHVHHLNLVRLMGHCVEGSYFLVYEYIGNGNLSQHLHGSGRDPLPWHIRVQIALDSARGLEYIHEYTVPVFIHCDIKSANILIDNNFRMKVADFGLTRLTAVGSRSRLVGTFGYMPLEYAQYGDVSPKVDVYAFGVVLYELISAKQAIIRAASDSDDAPKSLVALFDEVLSQTDPKDDLVKMIDPRLGVNYPLDSVYKMAQLAKACTNVDPKQRPSMRSVVVALMSLSTSEDD